MGSGVGFFMRQESFCRTQILPWRISVLQNGTTGSSLAAVKKNGAQGNQPAGMRNSGSAEGAPAFPAVSAVRGRTESL